MGRFVEIGVVVRGGVRQSDDDDAPVRVDDFHVAAI
jgi:hypothetical protein